MVTITTAAYMINFNRSVSTVFLPDNYVLFKHCWNMLNNYCEQKIICVNSIELQNKNVLIILYLRKKFWEKCSSERHAKWGLEFDVKQNFIYICCSIIFKYHFISQVNNNIYHKFYIAFYCVWNRVSMLTFYREKTGPEKCF